MKNERGGDIDALVEEVEFISIPSSEYLNEKSDLVGEFDASTCSDHRFYDIFDKEKGIITDGLPVWVNTNKTIWEGRVIKITFSDLPEYAKNLKLIWIIKEKEDRFLIRMFSK